MEVIRIGFGNIAMKNRIIAIVNPDTAPSKRLKERAKNENLLIDATNGKKTRSLIITDSNHILLSAINPETLLGRIEKGEK